MSRRPQDLENQLRDIKRQLSDQLGCFESRTESKLSLLSEFREFFKRRGDLEFEYARGLERLCERFEKTTKQRNLKHEVRSTFNLWSTMLAETRRMAKDRATHAETLALEMVARLDIMAKDVSFIYRKTKELCIELHDLMYKELKELNDQSKVYQYSCHHVSEAYGKFLKSKEKADASRAQSRTSVRTRKAEEKEKERQRQYFEQRHRLLKSRNDYLLQVAACNARTLHYYTSDVKGLVEFMDLDYHDAFQRLIQAYYQTEASDGDNIKRSMSGILEQTKTLNFENDIHYFLSEFSNFFANPPEFSYVQYGDDDVSEYKVNAKDVFLRAQEMVKTLQEEITAVEHHQEEDRKTKAHVDQVNLRKYRVQTIEDALTVLEDPLPPELSRWSSLEKGSLLATNRGAQALYSSQKGKEDTLTFTFGVFQRMVMRSNQSAISQSRLTILEKSLKEQRVPPVSVDGDYHVPKLFGGDCLDYINATGVTIPLVVESCCKVIINEGLHTEGIFRVPGPAQQIEELQKGFEEGRDPLYNVPKKMDVAAVASVLKMYFRALTTPLFPTDKYQRFIQCTRKETSQERIDAVKATVNELDPAIVTVMRFLFKFLKQVSQYSAETKMSSANLALVFGPTLTRAPEGSDPRALHNDVPAINVLIQLCIENNDYIFGEDEGELSSPPPPPTVQEEDKSDEEILNTSPDQPHPPPPVVGSSEEELERDTPQPPPKIPSPLPPVDDDEGESDLRFPVAGSETLAKSDSGPALPPKDDTPTLPPRSDAEVPASIAPSQSLEEVKRVDSHLSASPKHPTRTESQVSSCSLNTELHKVDEALENIMSTIDSMRMSPPKASADKVEKAEGSKEDEEGEGDSDSEDDDSGETMTMFARALYSYTARNEKELSFKKGDVLAVVEKSSDGNWWDGVFEDKRGYIPVSYVEIAPIPPQRRSSMKSASEEEGKAEKTASTNVQILENVPEEDEPKFAKSVNILSGTEGIAQSSSGPSTSSSGPSTSSSGPSTSSSEGIKPSSSPETMKPSSSTEAVKPSSSTEAVRSSSSTEGIKPSSSTEAIRSEQVRKKVAVPVTSGAVSKLTQQFQSTSDKQPAAPPVQQPPPPRVLVPAHKRNQSADMSVRPEAPNLHVRAGSTGKDSEHAAFRGKESEHFVPRSSSDGGSRIAKPVVPMPPPVKPKPAIGMDSAPTPTVTPFQLMPHDSGATASPLQKAALQHQVHLPPASAKKGSGGKIKQGSIKLSGKAKPPIPSKPAAPPKPASATQLQAEIQAAADLRRRRYDGDSSQ